MRRLSLGAILGAFLGSGVLPAQVFGPSGPELLVNTFTTGLQGGGSVSMSAFGDFLVVWGGEGSDGAAEVYARRYTFAAPVGDQFRVNPFTTGGHAAPRVALGPLDSAIVVWSAFDGDTAGVFGQRLQSGAAQGSEFLVNTLTTVGYQSYQQVASDGSGNFVVVWAGPGPDKSDVFGQRFTSAGTAVGPQFRVNTYTTGYQTRPAVARGSSGAFVVVWQSRGQLTGVNAIGIYGQRYASTGAPQGSPFLVNTVTTGAANPSVAMDANGKFVVAWRADTGVASLSDIYARRYAASGAALVSEFVVNTLTVDIQDYPLVTAHSSGADPTGTFVVAWTAGGLYGGQAGVFARRFTGDGVARGAEFKVNSVDGGFPSLGGIDHNIQGDFVVAWTQGTPGTQNVYLRRYCAALAGDVNNDKSIDVNDVFYLINSLFAGGPPPMAAADANGDGVVDVNDVFYLINYLFAGGPPPACPIVVA
jgi:hypothetical protein